MTGHILWPIQRDCQAVCRQKAEGFCGVPQVESADPSCVQRKLDLPVVLTLRQVFHLPLRQANGFVDSLLRLMDLEVPDHSTLSRRTQEVEVPNSRPRPAADSLDRRFTSSGNESPTFCTVVSFRTFRSAESSLQLVLSWVGVEILSTRSFPR